MLIRDCNVAQVRAGIHRPRHVCSRDDRGEQRDAAAARPNAIGCAARRYALWLIKDANPEPVRLLLVPRPSAMLRMHPLATAIGNVRGEGPGLIAPPPRVTRHEEPA